MFTNYPELKNLHKDKKKADNVGKGGL